MAPKIHPKWLEMERENDRLRLALDNIGRVALACWTDMQGRLEDSEHKRAHGVLGGIVRSAAAALGNGT